MFGGGQNPLSKALEASCTFGGGQNLLSKALQAYYTLCGGQNALSKALEKIYVKRASEDDILTSGPAAKKSKVHHTGHL